MKATLSLSGSWESNRWHPINPINTASLPVFTRIPTPRTGCKKTLCPPTPGVKFGDHRYFEETTRPYVTFTIPNHVLMSWASDENQERMFLTVMVLPAGELDGVLQQRLEDSVRSHRGGHKSCIQGARVHSGHLVHDPPAAPHQKPRADKTRGDRKASRCLAWRHHSQKEWVGTGARTTSGGEHVADEASFPSDSSNRLRESLKWRPLASE